MKGTTVECHTVLAKQNITSESEDIGFLQHKLLQQQNQQTKIPAVVVGGGPDGPAVVTGGGPDGSAVVTGGGPAVDTGENYNSWTPL